MHHNHYIVGMHVIDFPDELKLEKNQIKVNQVRYFVDFLNVHFHLMIYEYYAIEISYPANSDFILLKIR